MTKLHKIFPYIVAFSALLVSMTGSYYSIYGIGRIFAGHHVGAICMAIALEFGNIVTASALKLYWDKFPKALRNYLCSAVVFLSVITSIGIYGFLSDGYQMTNNKDKIVQAKSDLLKKKKERFEVQLGDLKKEKEEVNTSISALRKSLSTDNQYQTTDKRGNVLTQIQSTSKKGVQAQLDVSTTKSDDLSNKIDRLNDSVSTYEVKIIEVQATNDVAVELGALKYVSNLTGYGMDIVVNCFLIIIMIVFQPLAIALILAALFAFGNKKEEEKVESVEPVVLPTPDDKPEPVFVPEEKTKRRYKKRENKIPDDTEMDYPKTFDIQIEGLEPGEVLFPQEEQKEEIPEVVEEPKSEPVKEKKTRRRKVVERGLPEDLAAHISNSLSKKKP
jgi:chaperonin cofactor prefoldin